MDEQTLKQWQELHRKRIFGEPMTEAEWAAHEAGCQEIDSMVRYDGSAAYQQEILARMDAVEKRLQHLSEQEDAMGAEIADLKRQVKEATRQRQASGN